MHVIEGHNVICDYCSHSFFCTTDHFETNATYFHNKNCTVCGKPGSFRNLEWRIDTSYFWKDKDDS